MKSEKEYQWLNDYSNNNIPKQAVKDAVRAYQNFLKELQNFQNLKADGSQNQVFTLTHVRYSLQKLI